MSSKNTKKEVIGNIFVNYNNFPTLEITQGNGYLDFERAKKNLIDKLTESGKQLVISMDDSQIMHDFNIKVKDISDYYNKIVDNLQSFVDNINSKIDDIKETPTVIQKNDKKESDKAVSSFFSSYLKQDNSKKSTREKDRKKIMGVITEKYNKKLADYFKKIHKQQPKCYTEDSKDKKINKFKTKGFFSNTFNESITSNNCLEVYKILLENIKHCTNQLKLILQKYAELILSTTVSDINDEIMIKFKEVEQTGQKGGYKTQTKKTYKKKTNKTKKTIRK